jgi:hypothetical protein
MPEPAEIAAVIIKRLAYLRKLRNAHRLRQVDAECFRA